MADLPSRIIQKIKVVESGCWEWRGCVQSNGYGRAWDGVKTTYAHRFVYSLIVGDIPEGLDLDHRCRNRCCVNPNHLEPVTRQINIKRGLCAASNSLRAATKVRCKRGHKFTKENTRFYAGRRHCRACARDRYHRMKKNG